MKLIVMSSDARFYYYICCYCYYYHAFNDFDMEWYDDDFCK